MRAYPDLPADANVEAWLVTIAHRKAIDVTRAAARRAVPVAETPDTVAAAAADGPASGLDSELADAVAGLPAKQKQAVAYHYLGPLLLAATGAGLSRLASASEGHDTVLQARAARISPRIPDAPARLDAPARELEEYFTGRRRSFDLPLDWRLAAGFRRTVLSHLPEIGDGPTASYAAGANLPGPPKAVRAAPRAGAANPLPGVVPGRRGIY